MVYSFSSFAFVKVLLVGIDSGHHFWGNSGQQRSGEIAVPSVLDSPFICQTLAFSTILFNPLCIQPNASIFCKVACFKIFINHIYLQTKKRLNKHVE